MQNLKDRGDYGENVAEGYLAGKNYSIIERNFKRRSGEIDIIAKDGEYIVFIEVKNRRNIKFGMPCEAVTATKQRAIYKTALYYICENNLTDCDLRFDVIEVFGRELLDVNHIENAFSIGISY